MALNFYINLKPSNSESIQFQEGNCSQGLNSFGNETTIENPTAKLSTAKVTAIAAGTMVGKQTINYLTSNVGKWTGNSQNQVVMNNALQAIGLGIMAYHSPIFAIATIGIGLATTAINNYQEDQIDNLRVQQLTQRSGYRSYTDIKGNKH